MQRAHVSNLGVQCVWAWRGHVRCCSRTPFARRGWTASALSIGMVNGIENGPKHVAFKLESAHGLALELGCVAIFQRDGERFVRIALRLCDATSEIIKPARIDPRIRFLEACESSLH